MKKINILFLAIIMTLPLKIIKGQDTRSINFIHGFIGNSGSFEKFDNYFSERYEISTTRISYPSVGGLDACATHSMPQLLTEGENPMAIAHSMGGLVTRSLIKMGADIEGYITFGTPHQGAAFANNYYNGKMDQYISNFSEEVFTDVLFSVITPFISSIRQQVFNLFNIEDPHEIGHLIFRFVEYYIKQDTDDALIRDLMVGSDYIQNLPEPDVPKVSFYGVEDSPVHWRFLSSFSNSENEDFELVHTMEQLENYYQTFYYIGLATSNYLLSFPSILVPGAFWLGIYTGNMATQLDQAISTLQQSEAGWLDLIDGVGDFYQDCYTERIVVGWDYNKNGIYDSEDKMIRDSCRWSKVKVINPDSLHIQLEINCDDKEPKEKTKERRPDPCHDFVELYEEVTICSNVFDLYKTDGLVVYNATEDSGSIKWIEVPTLNHQELKYHPKTRDLLEDLFNNYGIFSNYPNEPDLRFFKLKAH